MDEVQGMTRDDIIKLAREAGLLPEKSNIAYQHPTYEFYIERFAALVAAHTLSNIDPSRFMSWQEGYAAGAAAEREACAQMLDEASGTGRIISCTHAAAAIRARGETK